MIVGEIARLAASAWRASSSAAASLASLRLNTRPLSWAARSWRPIGLHLARLSIVAGVLV